LTSSAYNDLDTVIVITGTDFTAKLVDIGPCGYARNIQDGIIRARYRNGFTQAEEIRSGEIY
jgi:uncharacterized protein